MTNYQELHAVREIEANAEFDEIKPEAPRPLFREMPPAEKYPVQYLGVLQEAAEAIQEKTQAPLALCAQSVLAAASLCVSVRAADAVE